MKCAFLTIIMCLILINYLMQEADYEGYWNCTSGWIPQARSQYEDLLDAHKNSLFFTSHFADFDPHGWGSLYEKYTGQTFEAEGYEVEYRGLTAGFNDGGTDLILRKGNDTIFVKFKHAFKSSLSRNSIENILYKAGNYISRNMPKNRVHLWLVVPDVNYIKCKRYFLRHNTTQNKVKLALVEIRMLSI